MHSAKFRSRVHRIVPSGAFAGTYLSQVMKGVLCFRVYNNRSIYILVYYWLFLGRSL